ncbi:MAG: 50S ribosomal protein L4 [Longimicrobiaceae bacterium]
MLTARYFDASGVAGDALELPTDPFDGVVNEAALHQVIKAQLANRRQGNAATKTRGMVRGGGRKIWRQKGTGRARQGSIRAPHWRGGGVVFGPSPRSYRQAIPRKLNALARRSAFNTKALAERVAVIEKLALEEPRTRIVRELLGKLGMKDSKLLILTNGESSDVHLASRNLPNVDVLPFRQVSAYELLAAGDLLIEADALNADDSGEGDNV